jgi:hypothetical protein
MKQSDLLLLGGAAILAYFLFKDNGAFFDSFSGGGGSGGGSLSGILGDLTPSPGPGTGSILPINPSNDGPVTPTASQTSSTHTTNVSPAQSWTGVQYGTAGQPSVVFIQRTFQSSAPSARLAQQAAVAGAPPRVVAKIKAGQHILD